MAWNWLEILFFKIPPDISFGLDVANDKHLQALNYVTSLLINFSKQHRNRKKPRYRGFFVVQDKEGA